jgi:hypothetical protein
MWAKEHLEQQYQAGLETQIAAQRGAGNGSTMFVQVEYLGWFQGTFRKEWLTVPAMTERLEALAANGGSGDDDYTGLGPDAGFDDGLDADEEDISFEERMRLSFVLVHRREPQQKELEDFMQTAYEEVETEKNVIERRIREQWGHKWGGVEPTPQDWEELFDAYYDDLYILYDTDDDDDDLMEGDEVDKEYLNAFETKYEVQVLGNFRRFYNRDPTPLEAENLLTDTSYYDDDTRGDGVGGESKSKSPDPKRHRR